jgi:hypothetical protein
MHIPATKNLILRGSRIVSLTAFNGLVHKLSVLLLSKDLFTVCRSYCFQRTCSHIGSGHKVPLMHSVLVLMFGSFNVWKQIELYKELYTPWKSGHEESPNFQSLFKSLWPTLGFPLLAQTWVLSLCSSFPPFPRCFV